MRLPVLRRLCVAALIGAIAVAPAGCDRRSPGVVRVLVIGENPELVDPNSGPMSTADEVLVANAAQGLVRFDARGQIVPGLAETWNVSEDGLSYIFRLTSGQWPNGRDITAEQVARMLRRLIAPGGGNALGDSLEAVEEVVAMTERVLEIRLGKPEPHLLQLLAQPAMGLVYEGQGSGPFSIDRSEGGEGTIRLTRDVAIAVEEEVETQRDQLNLSGEAAERAVRAFAAGEAHLVLGGTFADLPFAHGTRLPRRALQFDRSSGLFGLVATRNSGPLADPEVRLLLSEAIDREAIVAALSVPGLVPRTTVLEPGLDNMPDPAPPDWAATPLVERLPSLAAEARRLFEEVEPPVIRVLLPDGPGSEILLRRLALDWGALGFGVERAASQAEADLRLIDEVAPAPSAAWFVRRFRCKVAAVCDEQVDELLSGARSTPVLAQRNALLFEAARGIDALQLFIPIAAPIRWSLVSSRISGFAGNPFAVHTLTDLEQRLDPTGE